MNQGIVRLQLITHNARLVDARKQMEFTAPEFAAEIGISTGRLRLIETLKRVPLEDEICHMACVLEKMPEYLFPDRLLLAVQEGIFAKRHAELEMPHLEHLIEIKQPMLLTDGGLDEVEERLDTESLRDRFEKVFRTLTPREVKVLKLRFGLDNGNAQNLEDVGKIMNITRERVRQIEGKALRKLRHPSRSRFIAGKVTKVPEPNDKSKKESARIAVTNCDVCGEDVGSNKGQHILRKHPEYPITVGRHDSGYWGYTTHNVYYCGLCSCHNGSPAYMVRHINEKHPDLGLRKR